MSAPRVSCAWFFIGWLIASSIWIFGRRFVSAFFETAHEQMLARALVSVRAVFEAYGLRPLEWLLFSSCRHCMRAHGHDVIAEWEGRDTWQEYIYSYSGIQRCAKARFLIGKKTFLRVVLASGTWLRGEWLRERLAGGTTSCEWAVVWRFLSGMCALTERASGSAHSGWQQMRAPRRTIHRRGMCSV